MKNDRHMGSWTESELQAYARAELPANRAHQLESDMLDDPFLTDAVEGYQLAGGDLDTLRIKDTRSEYTGSGQSRQSRGFGGSVLFLSSLILVGVSVYWLYQQQAQVEDLHQSNQESQKAIQEEKRAQDEALYALEINSAQRIAEEIEVMPQMAKQDQAALNQQVVEAEQAKRGNPTQSMPIKSPSGVSHMNEDYVEVEPIGPRYPVLYIRDFKLYDYRSHYEGNLFIDPVVHLGTEARFERNGEGRLEQASDIRSLDYGELMNQVMGYFDAREYRACLLAMRTLEARYPDDLNRAFYGGLCYYNLGKWSRAEQELRRAAGHPYRLFDQEAEWYLALSLKNHGRNLQAQLLLEKIRDEGGFYAEKARHLLH